MKESSECSSAKGLVSFLSILSRYWPASIIAALFFIVQYPVLAGWWKIWSVHDSYFSHGPLIPCIFGYMVWANRKHLAQTPIRPTWMGFVVLLLTAVVFVLARWLESAFGYAVAFIGMLFGTMLLTFGVGITRLLTVPILFTLTMIPLSPTLLDAATSKLQLQSAALASHFLQWSGYEATLEGATILSSELPQPLIVGIPCSGLRTLISLLTFTFFFIYMVRATWWRKAILVGLSFPLAVFINSLRITLIGYVGFWIGTKESMQSFHDYSGYIGLAICFAILFGIAKLIGARDFGLPTPKTKPTSESVSARSIVGGGAHGFAAIALLALLSLANVYASPIYPSTKGRLVRENIPRSFGKWSGQDKPISKEVKEELKKGDLLSRSYVDQDEGHEVDVFIAAARDPEAFHDPHSCLPGGGHSVIDDRVVTLQFEKPRRLTVKATLLLSRSDDGDSVTIYLYMRGSESMPRTSDVWNRNRQDTLGDIRRLILSPGSRDDLKREIETRQFIEYKFATEAWTDPQTDTRFLKEFITEFVAHTKDFGG